MKIAINVKNAEEFYSVVKELNYDILLPTRIETGTWCINLDEPYRGKIGSYKAFGYTILSYNEFIDGIRNNRFKGLSIEDNKEDTMKLSLKELAEKKTIIKLEDEQDKKEFMGWYIAEGGSNYSDRYNIKILPNVIGVWKSLSGEHLWNRETENINTKTWKELTNKTRTLTEIKWDGKSEFADGNVRVIKYGQCYFICGVKVSNSYDDVEIRFNNNRKLSIEDVNKILALYDYKIVIEEPKYKIKFDGEYTAEEVKKLEELGLKFEKMEVRNE